jgi:hypothetical protein
LAALAAVCVARSPARAERERVGAPDAPPTSRSMRVTTGSCAASPWSASAWGELLAVELAADRIAVELTERASGGDAPLVELEPVGCDVATTAATLSCTSSGVGHTRQLDLADVAPVARPRVIAIAVADAVRSCVPADAPPMVVVERTEAPPTMRAPRAPVALGVLGEARVYSQNVTSLYGPRAFVDVPLFAHVIARGDGGVLLGTATDPLGTIGGTLASVGAGVRATTRVGRFELGAGVRGELGYGWFHGRAGPPTVMATHASSSLAYVAASGGAATRLAGDLGAELDVDVGGTVRGFAANADTRQVFDVEGAVVALRLGITWWWSRR